MTVSVIVVAYNEEKTLPRLFDNLKNQTYPHENIEIILVDSMSTDRTKEVIKAFAKTATDFKRIALFDNEKKRLCAGCNIALDNYTGDVFIRIDAHAEIPADFIEKNVRVIENGESVSGGRRPNIIDKNTPWKKTILTAESSMFGSSIADYRNSNKKRYVSSIFHGMYKREVFDAVGKYNETLWRTEDNEMSYRIRKAGFNICYSPDIVSYQHARATLKAMLRQKYLNGYWIGLTLGVCPKCLSLFHFVPLFFLLANIGCIALACFGLPLFLCLLWATYGVANLLMTVVALKTDGFSATNLLLPFIFLLLHLSYGIGTLWGLIYLPFKISSLKRSE